MDDETTGTPPGDGEDTRVTPPDDEGATEVRPGGAGGDDTSVRPGGAGEDATRVMPGGGEGQTRVMPATGTQPPRSTMQPTLTMSKTKKERSGPPWWVWVIVALVIVIVALILWMVYVQPGDEEPTSGQDFIGTWAREDMSGGGLVISQKGERFLIKQYDEQLEQVNSSMADLVDDQLELQVDAAALGITGATGKVDGTLRYDASSDKLELQFTSGDLASEVQTFVRADVLRPATASPSASPSASTSASPSASGSPSASPTTTASPTASADQQVMDGIDKLQVGIVTWATNNNNLYPPVSEVSQSGGVSQYVDPWPTNPFTGQAMSPGATSGQYTYTQMNGGQGYKLVGYLTNGVMYTVP